MPQYGQEIHPNAFGYVMNALDELNISWGIWNAEEHLMETAEKVEIVVDTPEDAEVLRKIVAGIPQLHTKKR